jgi:hypothetical protein
MLIRILYLAIITMLISFCVGSLFAIDVPPSPAGGNCLALDGKDDYAVLDFEKYGALLKKGTKELTVEAWVYPTLMPDKDVFSVIFGQQVVMYVVGNGNKYYQDAKKWVNLNNDDLALLMFAYTNPNSSTGSMYLALSRNKWHHIAFQVADRQTAWICDSTSSLLNQGISSIIDDLSKIPDWTKDFVLGGYGENLLSQECLWGSFAGYIDEVRISDIPRYDINKLPIPQGKFEPDANTIALWHFDESRGRGIFKDSSLNKYDLIGKNGADVMNSFAVNRLGKLAATWANIKMDSVK